MKNVLYLHGFASSPAGAKATALAARVAPQIELLRPDLNVPSFRQLDFDAIVQRAAEAAELQPLAATVGSSLGSLVALSLARRGVDASLLLIAPALGIADRWREKTPAGDPILAFHHGEGRELPIHRSFFERMMTIDVDERPPSVPVVAFMGTDDETVPFTSVERRWREWEASGELHRDSRLIVVEGGDHGLVAHVDAIAQELLRIVT